MHVKPAPGLTVRYPHPDAKRKLPAAGAEVSETMYWLRRLAAGDVVLTKAEVR